MWKNLKRLFKTYKNTFKNLWKKTSSYGLTITIVDLCTLCTEEGTKLNRWESHHYEHLPFDISASPYVQNLFVLNTDTH